MAAPIAGSFKTRMSSLSTKDIENEMPMEGFQIYRRQIPSTLLTPEKVEELSRSIAAARGCVPQKGTSLVEKSQTTQSASDAKRQLVEANLRLVLLIAKRYRRAGIDIMDLIQAGNLGLIHAAEMYDHHLGYAFGTYAIGWIRHYMDREVAGSALIAIPLYKRAEIKKLDRRRRDLENVQTASELTLEELANALGTSLEEVIELLSTSQTIVSIDRPYGDEEATLGDILEDDPVYSPEQVAEAQILSEQIRAELQHLPVLERKVIECRYGIKNESGFPQKEHTLVETGKKLHKSHETIRRVESRALARLKIQLKEYLDS